MAQTYAHFDWIKQQKRRADVVNASVAVGVFTRNLSTKSLTLKIYDVTLIATEALMLC